MRKGIKIFLQNTSSPNGGIKCVRTSIIDNCSTRMDWGKIHVRFKKFLYFK